MMKKILSVLLSVLMICALIPFTFAEEDAADDSFGAYKHVYIIGVDGLGSALGRTDTPNFDRIFSDGAYRYDCKSENITVSAQEWGSILTGVPCEVHGFDNDNTADVSRDSNSANGTIFRYVRQAIPDATLYSISHWHNINKGIIEDDLNIKKIWRQSDDLVTDQICCVFSSEFNPTLLFVQLDDVDHAGHSYGGQTEEYYEAVRKADERIGVIYDMIEKHHGMDDGLFIVVTDHGEANGGGHGGSTYEESNVIVAVKGKTVNAMTLPEDTQNRDVSAIALYALGVEQPDHMVSKVPEGLFGEEHEINVEKNKTTFADFFKKILYVFYRFANVFCMPWDFIVV